MLDRTTLRPTVAEVDLSKLGENLSTIRSIVGDKKIMAVVKANAYGHGLVPSAKHLLQSGADYLGVAFVEEGIELREAGIKAPILVFGGIFNSQIKNFLDYDLELTASSTEKLDAIEARAKEFGKRAKVHLKIDTGMERIGVHYYSAEPFFERASKLEHSDIVGIFSHFASSGENKDYTMEQLDRFNNCIESFINLLPLRGERSERPLLHIANSAATILHPSTHLDMVRCGISLYGVYPHPSIATIVDLKPAMRLVSRVVYFKVVRKGSSVGYGQTWTAEEDTRVVTVPIGYGDGYFRSLSNKGEVLIRGKRYPIVGRVSMDQIMVSVGQDDAFNGDEVVLMGAQGDETITASELAEHAGSYSYEVLTATNTRVPRLYI